MHHVLRCKAENTRLVDLQTLARNFEVCESIVIDIACIHAPDIVWG